MSRVEELHRASLADPDAFWGEAARAIDWTVAPQTVLDRSRDPFVRWFPDGELNTAGTASTATSRRPRRPARARLRLAGHRHDRAASRTASCRTRSRALAGALAGLGVGRGDRVVLYMPMVPEAVFGMLACARLGAVHSVVFGGFAPRELAIRIDDAQPKVILSASCGIEGAARDRLQAAARPGDRARRPQARRVPDPAAAAGRGDDGRGTRPRLGRGGSRRARRPDCVPVRSHRPALHPLHLGHHRPAEGRRARQRRPRGRAAVVDAERLRHPARRRLLGGLRRRLGRRPLLHRLRAAAARLHDDPLRGQAGRHARTRARSGAWSPSTACGRCSPRRRRSARSRRRIPSGALLAAVRPRRRSRRCSWPASAPTPTRTTGPRDLLGVPGDRPLVADRDRLADRGELHRHRAAAGEARLADEAGARLRRADPARERGGVPTRARRARSRSACRCRPARCRRCGTTTSGSSPPTSSSSRATT